MIRFQINKRINKPLNVVFRVLADVDQFVQAHPLMEKAEKIRPQHYIIHEFTPIGMWKFRFTYPAVITADTDAQRITMRADVFKLLKINLDFQLQALGEQTDVNEFVQIEGISFLARNLKKVIEDAHEKLFENISSHS